MTIEIYTDGICEPNPGHACWAWIARKDGQMVAQDSGYLGERATDGEKFTNNDAEYVAIGKAIRWAQANAGASDQVIVRSDSQLAVKQIQGAYQCNKDRLRRYRDAIRDILGNMPLVGIEWISSAENSEADNLTRTAYKAATGKNAPIRHKG